MEIETLDTSTEEKIKIAARKVFYKKGYAATRTRDIAEEADINLALLNYYFQSKKKLFDIIMYETVFEFVHSMAKIMNNADTSFEEKVKRIASNYIDFIIERPDIPIFMLHEIRDNIDEISAKLPIKNLLMESLFFKQFQDALLEGKLVQSDPMHFLVNLWGLTIFPFLGKPLIMGIKDMSEEDFTQFMQERKALIPIWIKALMKA